MKILLNFKRAFHFWIGQLNIITSPLDHVHLSKVLCVRKLKKYPIATWVHAGNTSLRCAHWAPMATLHKRVNGYGRRSQ